MTTRQQLLETCEAVIPSSHVLMPYSAYAAQPGVYFLSDFSIGMAWELAPRGTSHLSGDQKDQIARRLASTFSRMDDHVTLQFIAMPSAVIDDEMENFLAHGGSDQLMLKKLEEAKSAFFREGVHGLDVPLGDVDFRTKKMRILVTMTVRAEQAATSLGSTVWDAVRKPFRRGAAHDAQTFPAHDRFSQAFANLYRALMKNAGQLEGTFKSSNMLLTRLPPQLFLRMIRSQVQLTTGAHEPIVFDQYTPINEQALSKEVRYNQDAGHVYCDGMYHRLLSVASFPDQVYTGLLSEPSEHLGFFSLFDYVHHGVVCVNIYVKPRYTVMAELERRLAVAQRGVGNPLKKEVILRDLQMAQQWVIQEGRRLLDVSVTMSMAHEDPKVAGGRIEMLQAKMAELGFRTRIEETPAPSLWFQQLPFGYKPSAPEARRSRPLVDLAAADLLPIYLMGRGTKSNVIMNFNRLGEPFGWHPFDSNSGYHMAILGQSGSGKSFQINGMVLDFLRQNNRRAYIIDKGRSYVQLVNLLGADGQFCNITMREKTCINVFAGTYEMAGAFLMQWLSYLCERNEADRLGQIEIGKMEAALRETFVRKQDRAVPYRSLDDLQEQYALDQSAWIEGMRKRVEAEPLDEYVLQELLALKGGDGADIPQFEIYSRVRILGRNRAPLAQEVARAKDAINQQRAGVSPQDFRDLDEYAQQRPAVVQVTPDAGIYRWVADSAMYEIDLSNHVVRVADITGLDDLWEDDLQVLRGRWPYVEEDEAGVYVLATSATAARILMTDGWQVDLDDSVLVVEAAQRSDCATLVSNGLRVRIPKDYRAAARRRIEQEVHAEYGAQADPEQLQSYVDDRMRHLDPCDYFDTVTGQATIQHEVLFRDFAEQLRVMPDMDDLLRRLGPYYGKGVYAGFFDGPTQFDLSSKRILCWECGELFSAGEHLVGAVLGAIFQMINIFSQSAAGGRYEKLAIIDEFYEFNKSPVVTDFVETTLRQGRKHRLAIGIATQSATDIAEGPARKLLELIQFTVIGMQKAEVVARLGELMRFTPEQAYLAASCITEKGLFSEFMLVNNDLGVCEVQRIIAPPLLYWAFTTDGADREIRDQRRKELQLTGLDAQEALIAALVECAQQYPKGVSRGRKVRL